MTTATAQPEPLTDAELDAIEARADAATPGPWEWSDNGYVGTGIGELYLGTDRFCVLEIDAGVLRADEVVKPEDRSFAAAARTDVPRLVAEVRRLRAERDDLRLLADGAAASPRYFVGRGGEDELGLILILDNTKHFVIARSSEHILPEVEELARLASVGARMVGAAGAAEGK